MPSSTDPSPDRRTSAEPSWQVEHHAELPSTSDRIRALAAAGAPEGVVVVADRQTAGRGRHGRGWISPVGNLYLTLLLRPCAPAQAAGGLALVAGLSLAEACIELGAPPRSLRLKWPNDLVAGEAKVAGILLEADSCGAGDFPWVSIGIGVNIHQAPAIEGRPSAALQELVPDATAAALQARLLARIWANYTSWREQGMAAVVGPWSSHGLEPGTPILVKPGRRVLEGRYVGIDAEGALLVDTGEVIRVTTGEVLLAGEALAAQARPT